MTNNVWNVSKYLPNNVRKKRCTCTQRKQEKRTAYPRIEFRQLYQNCTVGTNTALVWLLNAASLNSKPASGAIMEQAGVKAAKHLSSASFVVTFAEEKVVCKNKEWSSLDVILVVTPSRVYCGPLCWCCTLSLPASGAVGSCGAGVSRTAECTQQSATGAFGLREKRQSGPESRLPRHHLSGVIPNVAAFSDRLSSFLSLALVSLLFSVEK